MVPAGEPGHVADIADDSGSDHRADTEDAGQAGPGGPHRRIDLFPGPADPAVDIAQVPGVLGGELPAGRLHGVGRGDRFQDPPGLPCGDLPGDAAGDQLAQYGVQPAGDLVRDRPRSLYRWTTFSTAA